jgi:hypothetical protein
MLAQLKNSKVETNVGTSERLHNMPPQCDDTVLLPICLMTYE